MSARRPIRGLLVVACTFAILISILLSIGGVLSTPSQAAPAQTQPLTITLDSLTPLAPVATDTLVLSGTIANRSEAAVASATVRLRVARTPIADRQGLAAVAANAVDTTGTIVDNTRTAPVATLYPGQSAPFAITVPMADLQLGDSGVYLLILEAQVDPGDGNLERSGLLRTYLPWFPTPASAPVTGVVSLWPLSAAPAVDADDVLLTDALPQAIAPGGRLRVLLDAGATSTGAITWLVDPSLVQTVDSMSDGYRVRQSGDIVVGAHPEYAATWLDELRRVTARADVMSLPYAVPDDVALVRSGQSRDVVRSITAAAPLTSSRLGRPVPSVIAWPTNGLVDRPTLDTLADAAPRATLLSPSQLRNTESYTPSGLSTIPGTAASQLAVVPDGVLTAIVSRTYSTPSEILLARQRVLAELAVIGLEISAPRTVVVAPPVGWASTSPFLLEYLRAISGVPWARPTELSTLLGGEPTTANRSLSPYSAKARAAELPPRYIASLAAAQSSVDTVADVVSSSGEQTRPLVTALSRAPSGWFRAEREQGLAIIAQAQSSASTTLSGVRIVSKGTVTLPGDTGIVPLSIANTLGSAVTVSLAFSANPSVRLSAGPVAPITIPPGATTLVEVPARVSGSEPVALTVRLTSSSGQPFGVPAELRVGTSAYSRAATWVVAAAFGVLVLLLLVNGARRLRQARRGQSNRDAIPADDTMSE